MPIMLLHWIATDPIPEVSTVLLAGAASPADLLSARVQMGFSLGWHIIVACFGVGFPPLLLFAEWRGIRTGQVGYRLLARRWARIMGVLFAVGAVSGTILSFEMGMLWPGLMQRFGSVYGFPFALEGFAFFIEAIFLGIYLYGWDRLSPRAHLASGLPIAVAGIASAFFVVAANSWMNAPTGFRLVHGRVVDPRPWAAMFNPATAPEATHMILAAIMVTAFAAAAVYAVAMLRGRRDRYHRLGLLLPLTVGAVVTPAQIVVGDWAARFVADDQPTKLAAMEGLYRGGRGVPEAIGGYYSGNALHGAIKIPDGLSLLLRYSPNGHVRGLAATPPGLRPPVTLVHLAFDTMVGLGFALLLLGAWLGITWWRRRRFPTTRWFLRAVAASGIAATVAMEAGWVTTEVGRQPWVVYHLLTVAQAINPAPGLRFGLYAVLVIYTALTIATVAVIRWVVRRHPVPAEPRVSDVEEYQVI